MPHERVVITGAAGFIGSHLAEALLDRGYAVIGIDNLLTGDTANIAHLRNRDFEFIKHDVTNYIYIEGPVHYVLHWASPASPIDYLELPIPTLKVGALGTHKALGLAKAKGARFVIASTSEVYGDPLEHPQKETYWGNVNPIGPRGVYDEAKRFAEAMTVAYHRFHGLDAKIVRIFNTYGPRMRIRDGRAVPAFISQALRNEDVTVFGDGRQTRSFCYISDLVDGIIRLMLSSTNDPVNIGNPAEMTIEEIARVIIEMTGSKSKLVYKPLPEDDPKVRKPDITRARTLLGWEPKVDLRTGLTSTIDYFKTKISGPAAAGGSVNDLGDAEDVVDPRDQGDRKRRPDERVDDERCASEVVEVHHDHAGQDEKRGRALAEERGLEGAGTKREVDDRHRQHDADVAADDEHGQPDRNPVDEAEIGQRQHHERGHAAAACRRRDRARRRCRSSDASAVR